MLMHCGQPGLLLRCRDIGYGRRQSPQSEAPVSHYWFPELLRNPYVSLLKIERRFSELHVAEDSYCLQEINSPSFDWE